MDLCRPNRAPEAMAKLARFFFFFLRENYCLERTEIERNCTAGMFASTNVFRKMEHFTLQDWCYTVTVSVGGLQAAHVCQSYKLSAQRISIG